MSNVIELRDNNYLVFEQDGNNVKCSLKYSNGDDMGYITYTTEELTRLLFCERD